jgi:hypothetical protein
MSAAPIARAAALLFALALPGAAAAEVTGRFERTLQVTGRVELDVDTGAGKISVRAGRAGAVRIVGQIRAMDVWDRSSAESRIRGIEKDPPVAQQGNIIRVGHALNRELRKGISINFEITVPADARLHAETGLGDILADGLRGDVRAETGAGSIFISNCAGEVQAGTGLGGIEVRGAKSAVRAKTGSGNLTVEGAPAGIWKLETGLGNVSVRVEEKSAFDVEAHTGLGSVHTRHPLEVRGDWTSSEVRGKVRGGGPLIQISTGLGSIHID